MKLSRDSNHNSFLAIFLTTQFHSYSLKFPFTSIAFGNKTKSLFVGLKHFIAF